MLFNFTLSFPEPSCILLTGFFCTSSKAEFTVVSLWFNMSSCSIKKAEGEAAKLLRETKFLTAFNSCIKINKSTLDFLMGMQERLEGVNTSQTIMII